jgi:voltage-dependent calcium channel L type alpha-1D
LKTDQDFLDDDGKEYDETVEERRIRLALKERNSDSKCRKAFYDLVTSVSFNFFIFILIIGNTATLALYSYD